MVNNSNNGDRSAELRRKAEAEIASLPTANGEIDAKRLLHELQVHQIELEMQNEELRQTQKDLTESRDHYSDLYDFAPVGYVTINDKGLIIEANLILSKKLDIDRQELVNRPFSAFTFPEDQDVYFNHQRKVIESHPRDTCQLRLLRRDAEPLWVEMDSIKIEGNGENISCMRTSISDISEKKKLQAQHIRTSQLASLGELAAGMAHEINNPINGVINYTQMLLNRHPEEGRDRDRDRDRDILSRIIKESNRIASIVHNLLGFAYINSDENTSLKVEEIINEPLQLVLMHLRNDGISVEVNISNDLPKIIGNRQKLGQVVLNLISNARYALNEKHPEKHVDKVLKISARQDSCNGEKRLQLTILDQGCGIPKEHMDKLFVPFFTTKAAGVGTGLGLSISHDILLEHGATAHVVSDVGQFTRFVVEFPVVNEAT